MYSTILLTYQISQYASVPSFWLYNIAWKYDKPFLDQMEENVLRLNASVTLTNANCEILVNLK